MKEKKGFTLIELLAVIVILAVIALIATPIIMNVIHDSKEGSAKDSMYGYAKAVELSIIQRVTPALDLPPDGTYTTKDGNIYAGNIKLLEVSFKGTKPDDGGIIRLLKGAVVSAILEFDGIEVKYDGNGKLSNLYSSGDIVYYNPETNKKCSSGEINASALAKTGCLKWNVITTDDTASKTTVNIMLDHNTTRHVAWASKADYIADGGLESEWSNNQSVRGPLTVNKQLQLDVSTWHSSVKSTVRLITGQEVADIMGVRMPQTQGEWLQLMAQSWLYQNLSAEDTDAKPNGYWVGTAFPGHKNYAFEVRNDMRLSHNLTDSESSGIRPVITVSKSVIL